MSRQFLPHALLPTVGSVAAGLVLAIAVAGPAGATPPPTPTPTPPLTALTDAQTQTSVGDGTALSAPALGQVSPAAAGAVSSLAVTAAATTGERQTFTRGGSLAWSSDTFEWYWSGSSMSSSTAWQADGWIFPNTVTLLGVKRTLATSAEHLWYGKSSIGSGVVTPWGSVNIYSQTFIDYFTLKPGKLTHSDS